MSHSIKRSDFLLITIGSEAIRAAVFTVDKNKASKTFNEYGISKASEQILPIQEKSDYQSLLDVTLKSIDQALKSLEADKKTLPKKVHVLLESPWYLSQTRIVSIDKTEPFIVTKKFMMQLKEREHQVFRNEHAKELEQDTDSVLEEKIMSVRLNGYDINDPINKKVKSFGMSLYISVIASKAKKEFEKAIHRYLPHADIRFHTSAFSSYIALRDVVSHMQDFLIVTVEGELSDVHYVNQGLLLESVTIPYGLHTGLREVSTKMKRSVADIESYVRMSSEAALETTADMEMEKTVAESRESWKGWFEKALQSLSKGSIVPTGILLISEGENANWIKKAIESETFMKYRIHGLSFTITEINFDYLRGYYKGVIQTKVHPTVLLHGVYIIERLDI